MHLAGQDEIVRRRPEAGYAMAALIVSLAVMAVMMTVAMPVWKQTVQREKEEEMVFRGEQIAHSIGLFQRKYANAYPPTLDLLVEQKFLRKKYKDPITNEDFVALTQAQAQAATPGGPTGTARGAQPQAGTPAAGRIGGGVGTLTPGAPTGAAAGGIIGVTSKSTNVSIRLYKGRSHYNEWAFVYTPPAQATAGPGQQGPGGRGNPQNPNNPANPNNPPFPGGGGFPGRGGRGDGRGPFPGGPGGDGRGPFGPGQSPFPPIPGRGR